MSECIHREAIKIFHPDHDKAFICQRCGMNSIDDGRTWHRPNVSA